MPPCNDDMAQAFPCVKLAMEAAPSPYGVGFDERIRPNHGAITS